MMGDMGWTDIYYIKELQFRTRILQLEIETGRYVPIFDKTLKKNRKRIANERLCKLCRLMALRTNITFCVSVLYITVDIKFYLKKLN